MSKGKTKTNKKFTGFSGFERAAMKERAKELVVGSTRDLVKTPAPSQRLSQTDG